ncbi:MAG TPA: DUF3540 domain-containing protein [Polyangiaceae bacterium]|jgi:hypothetical protein|nr:DUF3540 domain-containing protein [Polyangiaceae bacterium]
MNNLARRLEDSGVFQEMGDVIGTDGSGLVVRTSIGDYSARRAASCLLTPEINDFVLLAGNRRGDCYILAVLERRSGTRSRLTVDGDLDIHVPAGRMNVSAQDGVNVTSGKDVSVVSVGVNVNAVEGNVVIQKLSLLGAHVRAEVEKLKTFAGSVDSVMDRLVTRAKRSYRFVEETDQVKAERIDYAADKSMSLRGENAILVAEELVKVDGGQIHLG